MNQNKITFNQLSINPSSIARLLGIAAFSLIFASIGVHLLSYYTGIAEHKFYYKLISFFDVDVEQNIPTFFSMLLLFFATLLLLVITLLERKRSAPHVIQWAILAFTFFYMTIDEITSFHEILASPIRMLLGNDNLGIFYYAWVIPYLALVIALAIILLKFFLHLDSKIKLTFLIAAILYVGGALGFELIGGRYYELHSGNDLTYRMYVNIEESLEMSGSIVFIWGLLKYIAEKYGAVQFLFDKTQN